MSASFRRAVIVLALGIATALGGLPAALAAQASAAPVYPIPDRDPFYAAPADLAAHKPGDVLRVRPMPPLVQFPNTQVWQVLFRSTNSERKPIAADTTLLLPAEFRPGGPLLSYQHIINGLGTQCKVAEELYTTDPNLQIREAPALNVALRRGWAVALPDHLGPTSAYGAAKLGGQITLDGIRAVQRVPQFHLAASPVGLAGYSGGGMATGWAAALAPTYAPELRIVGAAEGGVPMNIAKMARALGMNPHPAFGLAMAAGIGLEREYPDRINLTDQLNAEGRRVESQMANGCTNEILAFGAGHSAAQMTDNKNFMDDPGAWQVMNENSLELYPGVPKAPIFEWHSPTDVLIPVDSIEHTVARYCRAGVKVQTLLTPSPDHLSAAVLGAPVALNWLDARFRGEPAPSTCPPVR